MADQALLAAVTGIDANQTYLDTIGNNIANANTDGYKEEDPEFVDLLTEQISGASAPVSGVTGGVDPISVGAGVSVGSMAQNLSEGTLEQTGEPTDVAIEGSGYLIAQQNGLDYYTRAGHMVLDANGDLTTPSGAIVQGWQATDGVVDSNAPTGPVSIPTGQVIQAAPTTEITVGGNLPAWNGTGTPTPVSSTITAYDSLGNAIPVTLTYTPVAATANEWTVQGTVPGAADPLWDPANLPVVTFDGSTGQMDPVTGLTVTSSGTATLNADGSWSLGVADMPSNYPNFPATDTWSINFPPPDGAESFTQFAGENSAGAVSQDGEAAGTLTSFSIGSDGTITGSFSNGVTQSLGQLALASFSNPGGLQSDGGLMYQTTPNSGPAIVGTPGTGGRGTLVGGSLETSNVDLGSQLTDLVVAQEAYSANTKVVQTASQDEQALVSMA